MPLFRGKCCITINNIFYADDVLLKAKSLDEMNQLLEITNKYGQEYEIKFNPNKRHFMIMFSKQLKENRDNEKVIMFQNQEVKRVIMMKYLGMWIDETFNNKKSLVMDLTLITNAENITEMINRGNKIMFESIGNALWESKQECLIEIKDLIKSIGDERRIKLNQMLRIEY
ncbi:unnamed protein product [Brachionus calyciflorus]|uniref:Reverse transcriptase domain-containing protein n=1 Tax=Brachionus calyciflorus TaxID=104777 RepID=A0A813RWY9_9BILA|nr:unnamed protein product [Brachionus calyciflorus]